MRKPPTASSAVPTAEELLRRGLQLHQSGRADEAAAFYERVLSREPANPAANHLLGVVMLGRGEAGRAADLIARAVAGRPREPQYLGNLGVALNATARHREAVEALHRALAIKPDFAEAWSNLGMAYRELRQLDEAAEAYRRAIEIRPGEAGFHFNLGNVLSAAGDIVPAEVEYGEALRLRPGYPGAADALGGLLGEAGRYEEGLAIVDAALVGAPREAKLHLRQSRLLHQAGRLEAALAGYTHALELRPAFGEAHLQRANLRRHQPGEASIAAMRSVFADESIPYEDRVFAGFGLGKALADISDHDGSVETFIAANRMVRARTPFSLERAVADLEADLRRVGGLAGGGGSEPGPIFVVGLPRAGKSTIEAILARHPDVAAVGELPTLGRLSQRLFSDSGAASVSQMESSRLSGLAEAYRTEAERFAGDRHATVDTMPSNYRLAGVIAAAMPNARIIWCMRQPDEHRIAILEKYLTGRGHEYANDPDELVAFHRAYMDAVTRWQALLPESIHVIDVADLWRDRAAGTRELLAFCGLGWDEACMDAPASEPQLGDWDQDQLARNRLGQRAAWRARRPDLFG